VTNPRRLVADRYRLVRPLGAGGMARVWLAQDEELSREVAIKEVVPPPGLTAAEQKEMGRRMLGEARATARLNHPNVVRMYDVVHTEVHPWLVMEYVPSKSLHQVIDEAGRLPPQEVAKIGLGVLAALRAAHGVGVLHRDVKPSNVLLGDDGRVILTDFGLAVMVGDASTTRAGLILGSPAYISPERALDAGAGPESDLWSLAATLYAALEGESPFARSTTMASLAALVTEQTPPSPHAGPLQPLLDGLLRKDPATRISAAAAEQLLRYAAGVAGGPTGDIRLAPYPGLASTGPSAGGLVLAAPVIDDSATTVLSPAGATADESATTVLSPSTRPAPVGVTTGTPSWWSYWRIPFAVFLVALMAAVGATVGSRFGDVFTPADAPVPPSRSTAVELPEGWEMYHDPAGFTMAAPTGSQKTREAAPGKVTVKLVGRDRVLMVARIDAPGPVPVQRLVSDIESTAGKDFPGYQKIKVTPVQYWPYWLNCIDWEFSVEDSGDHLHGIFRAFVTPEHQVFMVMWMTREADWSYELPNFQLVTSTLQPKA